MEGIVRPDGRPLMLTELIDEVDPVIGFQITHQVTGRILPTCNRFEIYETVVDAMLKMNEVAEFLMFDKEFDIFEYEMVELRRSEVSGAYLIINFKY